MDRTFTEREVLEARLGRKLGEHELGSSARAMRSSATQTMVLDSEKIYKQCDICYGFVCVNNWPDGKSRTPRFLKFIVCPDCDPRHIDDRYKKEGYRIVHKDRLRVIRLAQVARAMSIHGCLHPDRILARSAGEDSPCKCAGCASGRLFPPF